MCVTHWTAKRPVNEGAAGALAAYDAGMRRVILIVGLMWCAAFADERGSARGTVRNVGHVRSKDLIEASGLVASHKDSCVLWTHNDGDDGVLFAIRADGSAVGEVKVDAKFRDWEDIASDGEGNLYFADVGNNSRDRKRVQVFRAAEPDPQSGGKLEISATYKLSFPNEPFNCESLFIWEGHGYLISKVTGGEHAAIYRFELKENRRPQTLERVCELPIDEPVTAADISEDGKRLAVLSQRHLNVFTIDGDVKKAADAKPLSVLTPPIQAEGCCFNVDGVMVIAESGEILQVTFDALPATTQALK